MKKLKIGLLVVLLSTALLAACQKQDQAPQAEQATTSEAVASNQEQISAEQQAAIDALDKPLQDENNSDVPEEVANAAVE